MTLEAEIPLEDKAAFFAEGEHFGDIRAKGGLMSRLTILYPRKLGPILEALFDLRLAAFGIPSRLARKAATFPPKRKVLIIGVELPAPFRSEISQSRHDVTIATKEREPGLFRTENLNILMSRYRLEDFDWLVITDDDVEIPPNFLDQFVYLAERFGFRLVQSAHRLLSYASYELSRRHWGTVARRVRFVEIGPIVAIHRDLFRDLLPLAGTGMGWGLDVHWAFLAKKHDWKLGIIDAVPIRHTRPIGGTYDGGAALEDARKFVRAHGGLSRRESLKTLENYWGP